MANKKLTNVDQLELLAKRAKQELTALETKIKSEGYQNASQVQAAINAKLGSVYTPAGSKSATDFTSEALQELLVEANSGKVFNLKDKLTVTQDIVDSFVDTITANTVIPAGTNLVVVSDSDTYKLDLMSGIVDLSNYVQKDGAKQLSTEDFTTALKTKLEGLEEFTHTTGLEKESGLYKVTVDERGHVTAAEAVTKEDITALEIPGQDTTYSDVVASGASGLMSGADKAKLDGIDTAEDAEVTAMLEEVFGEAE